MDLVADISRSAETRAGPTDVYALLADVPRSIAHFPELEELVARDGFYEWRLPKLGAGPLVFQVTYACRYRFDPHTPAVRWDAVPGVGNTRVEGSWTIEPLGARTRFTMRSRYVVVTPFPSLLRGPAEAIMVRENERILGAYLRNLVTTLEGGDGRVRR